jgi:ATP-binding cassette subfamily B protein
MGLLTPQSGNILIDGQLITAKNNRSWQSNIAHVPQNIFLADSSVAENIAFGIPVNAIDMEKVRHAARRAQIADVIEAWPETYSTFVGERGIRLSGGQRQRIGIARALYKSKDVLILDEATSALDNDTERAVMQSIEKLGEEITIFIVAHRLTTLKACSTLIEIDSGKIKRIGSYSSIVENLE